MKIFFVIYILLIANAHAQKTCRDLLLDIYNQQLPQSLNETKKVKFERGTFLWIDPEDLGERQGKFIKIEYIETIEEQNSLGNIVEYSLIKRLDTGEVIKYDMAQALGNLKASPSPLIRKLTSNEIIGLDRTNYKSWRVFEGDLYGDHRMLDAQNARFIKKYDEDHALIKISKYDKTLSVIVPNTDIKILQNAGEENYYQKLELLLSTKINLESEVGKLVRYRKNGKMEVDLLEKIEDNLAYIKNAADPVILSLDEVYIIPKSYIDVYTPKEPQLANLLSPLSEMSYQYEKSPLTIKFLNGAAKLSSTDDFLLKSDLEKIKILTVYSKLFMKYDSKFSKLSARGIEEFNMDVLLESGAGVCRHKSVLLMTILKESGFKNISIGISGSDSSGIGHAWVEVIIDNEKYILDTSNHHSSLKEINADELNFKLSVKKFSELDQSDNFVNDHYMNSENEYIYR